MATAGAAIEARGLTKRFRDVEAVRGVDLAVEAGTTFGLIGPSGCGKSPLIRLMLGLLSPTDGTPLVLGVAPATDRAREGAGYMPQSPALYRELSARQNLRFFARIYGVPDPAARTEELLELVELSDRGDAAVSRLSGGMQQRVSLACALVHRPRVLFLDEPTVGADPRLRRRFWDYFDRPKGEGVALLITSHVMDEAARCDRVGLMRAGRVVASGSVGEICSMAGENDLEAAFLRLAETVGER